MYRLLQYAPEQRQLEVELVLNCARTQPQVQQIQRIRNIVRLPLDWSYIFRHAECHRVLPLLYKNLVQICPQTIPDDVLNGLRNHYLQNSAANLRMAWELATVVGHLQNHAIRVVPFKGPVFTAIWYGDLALRQFGDLDILVSQKDVLAAYELLQGIGYQPKYDLGIESLKRAMQTDDDAIFIKQGGGGVVELHWELTGRRFPIPLTLERLENRLVPVRVEGKQFMTFPAEELLVYLCLHGTKHVWEQLDSVCCIAELIQKNGNLDWHRAEHLSRRWHCQRAFKLGLFLAHRLVDFSVPARLMNGLLPEATLSKSVFRKYYKIAYNDENSRSPENFLFQVRMRDNFADRVRFLIATVTGFAKKDYHLFQLPRSLAFLRYLCRFMRLTIELTNALVQRANKNYLNGIKNYQKKHIVKS